MSLVQLGKSEKIGLIFLAFSAAVQAAVLVLNMNFFDTLGGIAIASTLNQSALAADLARSISTAQSLLSASIAAYVLLFISFWLMSANTAIKKLRWRPLKLFVSLVMVLLVFQYFDQVSVAAQTSSPITEVLMLLILLLFSLYAFRSFIGAAIRGPYSIGREYSNLPLTVGGGFQAFAIFALISPYLSLISSITTAVGLSFIAPDISLITSFFLLYELASVAGCALVILGAIMLFAKNLVPSKSLEAAVQYQAKVAPQIRAPVVQSAAQPEPQRCPKCNSVVGEEDAFCGTCGAKLS